MSKIKKRFKLLITSLSIFIPTIILDHTTSIPWLVTFMLYILSYGIIGYDVVKKAILGVVYGKILDENFLMTIATIGAFAIGQYSEAVAVMLFYHAGELFQTIAVRKSRHSVKSLLDIRPEHANLVTSRGIEVVTPDKVQIGNIIEIRAGEKVALDGVVVSGTSTINTSMLTGESLPKAVKVGDKISSGCINIDGVIRVRVSTEYCNSTVSKILNLVQYAQEKKSKSENFITKFARIYTPIVCISALMLAILPPIFVGNWSNWIYRALCFLVVSCPCALVISIPLTFFAGIGCSSKNGILIKGSAYLEKLTKSDTIVFDKTGTLTKGTFVIQQIIPENRKEELLKLASIAEAKSTHPIAKAILDNNIKIDISHYTHQTILGEGVIAKSKHDTIIAGNQKLLQDNNIAVPNYTDYTNTIIHISHNNKYVGAIIIGDEIKEEAKETIYNLKQDFKRIVCLSGDNKTIASNVAEQVGISEYYYNMLPEDKINKLESIMKDSTSTIFVGDGINDSPSLVRADIGISMGKIGSDCAIESSDIVIMNDNLKNITIAKKIAKKTMTIVKQNIVFAIGVKIAILILSALGLSNMWWAIFGDVGVSVIAILNAIRALTIK